MTTQIKISPLPQGLTSEQVRNELGNENIANLVLSGGAAYVTLANAGTLEKLAGRYEDGDDLKIKSWASTIVPLESTFDFSSLVPEEITYSKIG